MDIESARLGLPAPAPGRRLGLLGRHRDFRLLWTAHTVSVLGDSITIVALPSVAILTLHAGALAVGVLTAAWGIAWGVFGLVAGVWADRLPRRGVMIACDLARLALIASIPAVYLVGGLTIWQLAVVAALAATATVFFSTASSTIVPQILDPADFGEANSRIELSLSTSMLTGPTVAGALIGVIGAPLALIGDAISFLASALLLRGMRIESRPATPDADRQFGRELLLGFRAVRERPLLMLTTCCAGISNIGLAASQAVLLLFVYRGLHLAPSWAGLALGLGAVGNMVGAVVAPHLSRRFGTGKLLLAATTIEGLAILPIELALLGLPVLWVAVALAARGLFNPIWNVNIVTVRQVLVPLELQGRVTAALRTVGLGAAPLGAVAGGALGQVLASCYGAADGYGLTLAISSVVAGASGLALVPRLARDFRL